MPKVASVRLSDELAARLEEFAAAVDRPRAWVIEQAIVRYLEEEAWQVAAIGQALAEYRAGDSKLSVHGDVMRRLEDRIGARLWPEEL